MVARVDESAWWEVVGEPCIDEDGYDRAEYELVGSQPLSPFEVMVLAQDGVSGLIDYGMEYLR